MFLGHYGVALALKRAEQKVSLGTLFLAAQLADLLWGIFLLLGWEHARVVPGLTQVNSLEFLDYPLSHSLVAAVAWGVAGAAIYYSWPTRDTHRHWQAAAVVGVAIFSHWPLDALVHLPDLPLDGDGSPRIGLGLWNHFAATVVVELLFLAIGVAVYTTSRSARRPLRPARLSLVTIILVGVYAVSIFGPPPPSMRAVAVSDIIFLLLMTGLAAWADQRATPEEIAAARPGTR
jgi:predicted membrane channel-forming protein YqfA (hemolysin III family)